MCKFLAHFHFIVCLCSWSFTVALKTLKPFDCEEAKELVVSIAHKLYTQLSLRMMFSRHSGKWSISLMFLISVKPKKNMMLQLSGPWIS